LFLGKVHCFELGDGCYRNQGNKRHRRSKAVGKFGKNLSKRRRVGARFKKCGKKTCKIYMFKNLL
jgi:hypothetical protein